MAEDLKTQHVPLGLTP